ncbi:hypothetical protein C7271_03050 [filamentous cyanobacterium CCP5]|nr:hypothetical protein C7271_03050 [filamentous cyanobacterium CCP5]
MKGTHRLIKLDRQVQILSKTQRDTIQDIRVSLGRIEHRQIAQLDPLDIPANEFKVFSQWGEDGIIQFLLRKIEVKSKTFVEFGVQNYTESNTRFLLINNNWSGLVLDGSEENIYYIKKDPIYWKYNLKAVHAFITRENINQLILDHGMTGEIGLLSVDIDGNDYWVWQSIDVISPAIVIAEYNFRFGPEKAVAIPYNPDFVRSQAHPSMIYYGASLKALWQLGQQKGYVLVGSNSAGNNAFFIRKDLKPEGIPSVMPEEAYVAAQFRESRDSDGQLSYLSLAEEQQILATLPLVNLDTEHG